MRKPVGFYQNYTPVQQKSQVLLSKIKTKCERSVGRCAVDRDFSECYRTLSPRFARCPRRQKQSTGLFSSAKQSFAPSLFESLFRCQRKEKRPPDGGRAEYGYSLCEDTHPLRLTSELADLRVGYANPAPSALGFKSSIPLPKERRATHECGLLFFGSGIGIRTPTYRVRVCCATVTQFRYFNRALFTAVISISQSTRFVKPFLQIFEKNFTCRKKPKGNGGKFSPSHIIFAVLGQIHT